MFKLAKYNNRTTITSGTTSFLSMKNDIQRMKQGENIEQKPELESNIQWIKNVYSGTQIDIKDKGGIYLMNSGSNITAPSVPRVVDPNLTKIIDSMNKKKVF